MILLIDGLNQLQIDDGHDVNMRWLPNTFPANVRVVVTVNVLARLPEAVVTATFANLRGGAGDKGSFRARTSSTFSTSSEASDVESADTFLTQAFPQAKRDSVTTLPDLTGELEKRNCPINRDRFQSQVAITDKIIVEIRRRGWPKLEW